MIVKNIQVTIELPYQLDTGTWNSRDLLDSVAEQPLIRRLVKEGRSLISYGITDQTKYATELVLNFE